VLFTEGSLVQLSFVQKEYCRRVAAEYPGIPCFLFGHSTGGAIALKLALQPDMEKELQGVVVSSAAVKVKPAHPVIGVSHSCSLCSSLGFVHSIKIDALGFVYAYQVFPSF
jgi:alpha-beta hydrolase superfamily lysophospholipase